LICPNQLLFGYQYTHGERVSHEDKPDSIAGALRDGLTGKSPGRKRSYGFPQGREYARQFHVMGLAPRKIDFGGQEVQIEAAFLLFMKYIASLTATLLFVVVLGGNSAGAGSFSGKVAETMDAGGYTYVLVDTGTNKMWAAATKFPVKKGDAVTVPDAMPMSNFRSDSLKRDFPLIYFAGSITVIGANSAPAKLPSGHPPLSGGAGENLPAGHPSPDSKSTPPKVDFAGLKPAKDGKTVAEIYAARAKFGGQSVKVRGKVVKYNTNILGKNWLHIQDGTGSAGSNDLLVTTTGEAKRGDTVLIDGHVALNKDFGAGYKYDLLIEDAKVLVE
jgi:hypothetical protein